MRPRPNGRHFADDILKRFKFRLKFQWNLFPWVQYSSIGSDNGLVSNRRQALIRTNVGLGCRCTYASLGLNELKRNRPPRRDWLIVQHWKLSLLNICGLKASCFHSRSAWSVDQGSIKKRFAFNNSPIWHSISELYWQWYRQEFNFNLSL